MLPNLHLFQDCCNIPTEVTTADVGDWGSTSCGSGKQMLGGGCYSHGGAHKFEYNGPSGNADHWQCGGHGSNKVVSIICAATTDVKMDVGTKHHGGDWDSTTCASNYILAGGGCQAHNSPHVMQASKPHGSNGWMCGGHGGSKHVWAMCIKEGDHKYYPSQYST